MVFSSTRGDGVGRVEVEPVALHRHHPRLDVPVAAELLPAHLHVRAHDQVRPAASGSSPGPGRPAALERHPGEHAGLARPGGRAAGRVLGVRRVPQVGQDGDAAPLELGGLRVLVLVDHVLVDAVGHQLAGPAAPSTS